MFRHFNVMLASPERHIHARICYRATNTSASSTDESRSDPSARDQANSFSGQSTYETLKQVGFIGVPLSTVLLLLFIVKTQLGLGSSHTKQKVWPPIVWQVIPIITFFFSLSGYSAFKIWTHGGFAKQGIPLGFYFTSMVLIFLRFLIVTVIQKVDLALAQILVQLGVLAVTVKLFFNVQPVAAYFLCPVFLFTGLQSVRAFRNLKANPEPSKRLFAKRHIS